MGCILLAAAVESRLTMIGTKTAQAARVAGKRGTSLISDETFRRLYAMLLQCTMADERMRLNADYERGMRHEAGTAGVVACLRRGDSIILTQWSVLATFLHNGSLPAGRQNVRGLARHLSAAAGDALRHKLEKSGNVAVVFAGGKYDACLREAFAIAASQSLPVVYVLESGASLAEVCGRIPLIRVDGNDAVAVYRVAHESIARAREGGGPTIIECAAWTLEPDLSDPLERLERYLADRSLFQNDWKERLVRKFGEKLNNALPAQRDSEQLRPTAIERPVYICGTNAVA